MAGFDNKISNIIGASLPDWLLNQLKTRSRQGIKLERSNSNLEYLANKTAWVRLVSSVNLDAREDMRYFSDLMGYPLSNPDSLAKDFVLQGGTSVYTKLENSATSYTPRQGFKNTYNILSDKEVKDFGYRPMPGLTRVSIETQGKLGSIRMATIEFKVWDKAQLDIMDALYFKLGFTMYLEWGHTYHYKSSATEENELQTTELFSLDPFSAGLSKEKIQLHIGQNRRDSEGNYDAMLGMVVNFSFAYNQEGGYDCTLKMAGLGTLAEGIKTNQPSLLPDILKAQINSLNSIYQKVQAIEQAKLTAAANAAAKSAEEEAKKEAQKKEDEAKAKLGDYKNSLFTFQEEQYPEHKASKGQLWSTFFNKFASPPSDITTNAKTGMDFNSWDKYDYSDYSGDRLYISKLGLVLNADTISSTVKKGGITFNGDYLKSRVTSKMTDTFSFVITYSDATRKLNIAALYFATGENNVSTKKIKGRAPHIFEIEMDFSGKVSWNDASVRQAIDGLIKYITENDTTNIDIGAFKYEMDLADLRLPQARLVNNLYSEGVYTPIIGNYGGKGVYEDSDIPGFHLTINGVYNQYAIKSDTITVTENGKQVTKQGPVYSTTVPVKFKILLNDTSVIKNIEVNQDKISITRQYYDYQLALGVQDTPPADTQTDSTTSKPVEGTKTVQTEKASVTQSALECVLRAIQLYSLVEAIKAAGDTLDIGLVPRTIDLSGDISRNQIFSCGIFKDFIGNLIDGKVDENDIIQKFAKYGFNASLLSNKATADEVPAVNYKDLLTGYVIPYKINQDLNEGTQVTHPVYIQFGLLIMILNDICLLYDRKKESTGDKKTTPILYVDFNPETNFCLSNPSQLSVDGLSFLIPFEGTFLDYVKLFDPAVLNGNNEIIGTKDNKSTTKLFDPASTSDIFLNKLPKFKYGGDGDATDAHRGKIMKVLINIDYLFNIIKQYLSQDPTNSVYLKSLLDQILSDMNKTLGNFNALRVYYDDTANALQIVDDQVIPGLPKENMLNKEGRTDLPLYGASSIAKTLELKTDLSTKVNNVLAISANADWKKQASNSTDASAVGAINNFYYDRYINNRTEKQDTKTSVNDTQIQSAIKFNKNIQDFYGTYNPSPENVHHAINYFIERMSKNKNESFPTRASAMIPVSLGFTTDGISGFGITQGFTIPEQLLPYTYSTRALKVDKDGKVETDSSHKVGFITTGINHVIENNQWTTSIKGSMIYLKNRQDFEAPLNTSKELGGVAQYNPDNPTQPDNDVTIPPNAVLSNYPNTPSEFQNVNFVDIGIGNPSGDVQKINRNLLLDISKAAVSANVKVSITTAVSGHTSTPSRHNAGQAVDIAIINGKAVSYANRTDADAFVAQLKNLGYEFNSESGNPKAVLSFGFPKHDNHVHVSNNQA